MAQVLAQGPAQVYLVGEAEVCGEGAEAGLNFGAVHRRLVPGVVTDTRMEADTRVVTFTTGVVVHQLLVVVDQGSRVIKQTLETQPTPDNCRKQPGCAKHLVSQAPGARHRHRLASLRADRGNDRAAGPQGSRGRRTGVPLLARRVQVLPQHLRSPA
ncbi:hypothetical protein ACH4SK_42015 [Streptomyces inhibens]|uniref:hypothetical protein n=1 Tax=Streptomyces inhibens TaxID=2293571 RepID=UPI0037B603EF